MSLEKQYLQGLISQGTLELRCFDKCSEMAQKRGGAVTWTGWYSDYIPLRSALSYAHDSRMDIYHTLSPVNKPATNNALQPYQRSARDSDILRYKTLFIDFDVANKENGTTDDQIKLSMDMAGSVFDFFGARGFANPTIGCSGNGAHLRYEVDLPVSAKKKIKGILVGLSNRFSNGTVNVDKVVYNEARIARCLGSVNTKGGRKSYILKLSSGITDEDIFNEAAEELSPPEIPRRTWVKPVEQSRPGSFIKNWDIVGAFSLAGLYIQPSVDTGKHFVTCFNEAEHSSTNGTDTVIWEGQWPQYHCSHDHCQHLKIQQAIELLGAKE
ncbi:MAG: hypothetical protein DRQ39_08020 [Gammaproteobacteria bacterium]|nr:MAG: hypothetical protein DRQ39_08020 [Gammaproteobacteria bacterium]